MTNPPPRAPPSFRLFSGKDAAAPKTTRLLPSERFLVSSHIIIGPPLRVCVCVCFEGSRGALLSLATWSQHACLSSKRAFRCRRWWCCRAFTRGLVLQDNTRSKAARAAPLSLYCALMRKRQLLLCGGCVVPKGQQQHVVVITNQKKQRRVRHGLHRPPAPRALNGKEGLFLEQHSTDECLCLSGHDGARP